MQLSLVSGKDRAMGWELDLVLFSVFLLHQFIFLIGRNINHGTAKCLEADKAREPQYAVGGECQSASGAKHH